MKKRLFEWNESLFSVTGICTALNLVASIELHYSGSPIPSGGYGHLIEEDGSVSVNKLIEELGPTKRPERATLQINLQVDEHDYEKHGVIRFDTLRLELDYETNFDAADKAMEEAERTALVARDGVLAVLKNAVKEVEKL